MSGDILNFVDAVEQGLVIDTEQDPIAAASIRTWQETADDFYAQHPDVAERAAAAAAAFATPEGRENYRRRQEYAARMTWASRISGSMAVSGTA